MHPQNDFSIPPGILAHVPKCQVVRSLVFLHLDEGRTCNSRSRESQGEKGRYELSIVTHGAAVVRRDI